VALVFVLTMDKQNAINFQLPGRILILQAFPAIVFGLHRWTPIASWAVGMIYGTVAAYNAVKTTLGHRFDSVRDQLDRGHRLPAP